MSFNDDDYQSLSPHEKFKIPDYRELEREEYIALINQFMARIGHDVFFSDCVREIREPLLVLAIRILALLVSGRVSIDGIPIKFVEKTKEKED